MVVENELSRAYENQVGEDMKRYWKEYKQKQQQIMKRIQKWSPERIAKVWSSPELDQLEKDVEKLNEEFIKTVENMGYKIWSYKTTPRWNIIYDAKIYPAKIGRNGKLEQAVRIF